MKEKEETVLKMDQPMRPYQVEEAQYLNANRSYTFKPTHYTPALRNDENFSYGGGHSKVKDLDRICSNIMPQLGSNNNNNNNS